MASESRILPPTGELVRHEAEVETIRLDAVEGAVFPPGAENLLKVLMVNEELEFLRIARRKGAVDPLHRHDDHSTVAYLVSGRLRLVIGDREWIAEPGTVWQHPRGVPHMTETLEDSVQIEVKSPACKTW